MASISSNGKSFRGAGKGMNGEDRVRKETGKTCPRGHQGRERTGFPDEHPRWCPSWCSSGLPCHTIAFIITEVLSGPV